MALLMCALGSVAYGVQAVTRLAREEAQGRLGLLLSTRVPRRRLWAAWILVALGGSWIVLLGSSAALGAATAWATGDRAQLGRAVGAGVDLLVPVALVVAIAVLLQGAAPRWAGLAWAPVVWIAVVGMLAEPLRLPVWARRLSPAYAVGQVPFEEPDAAALAVMAALAAGCAVVALLRFRGRGLLTG